MLAVDLSLTGFGAGSEGDQRAFLAGKLSLKLLRVMHNAINTIFRDVRNLNAFG